MIDISKEAVEWIAQRADEQELDYDTPVADTLRALSARIAELEADVAMTREDALLEAAAMLEPSNPRDDWTQYAYDCYNHAKAILALIDKEPTK